MGGKSSKEPGLKRGPSFRRSQKSSFQRIQKKLEKVTKDIDGFSGTSQDEKYLKIKKNLTEIINSLEEISTTVKDKHKDTYQDILDKCFEELNKLDSKLDSSGDAEAPAGPSSQASPPPVQTPSIIESPMSSPFSERSFQSVQVNLVRLSEGDVNVNPRKNLETGSVSSSIHEVPSSKEKLRDDAMEMLHQTRKQIENIEGEIHTYKRDKDENLHGYIKETLTRILVKIDNMETYGNVQIKHERKLAMQRAQECLSLLSEGGGARAPKTQRMTTVIPKNVLSEMRSSSRFKSLEKQNAPAPGTDSPKLSKQVTFEINVNDELRDELYKIIHERIEEASSELGDDQREKEKADEPDGPPVDKRPPGSDETKKSDKPDPVGKRATENFENTDSEDEFDFVNVVGEGGGDSKNTPVLVTSF